MPITGQDFNAAANMGGSMNQAAMQIARLRYQQALQQQRQALMLGQMALRQHLEEAQAAHLNAQVGTEGARAGELGAREAKTRAQVGTAENLGKAVQSYRMAPQMEGPTQGGGTLDVQQGQQSLADIGRYAAQAAALAGRGGEFAMPQTVGANQLRVDPVSGGMTAAGPAVVSAGAKYQLPGQEPITNPKPANESFGNIDAALIKALTEGNINPPPPAGSTNRYSPTDMMLYQAATNAVGRATAPRDQATQGGETAPAGKTLTARNPQTGQRIKSDDGGKTWQPIQ